MDKLSRTDLYSLEQYAEVRDDFRKQVMAHKKLRQIAIGPNVRLLFEDRTTMQYQVQEMLRIEKIFEAEGIEEELGAYNPLIPDGDNWKVTMMIEFPDVEQRRAALARLVGIEMKTWVKVDGFDEIYPIANEDLERTTEEKTSSVHFMRYQLDPDMIAALKSGAVLYAGIDHPQYSYELRVDDAVRAALVEDLD